MQKQQYIIAGIGTEVGKTVISAIMVQHLQADYWKPVQAGELDYSDTDKVKSWVSSPNSVFHPEAHQLQTPMSPHAAAAIDGVQIDLSQIGLPKTDRNLIVELAGGLHVPLNQQDLVIDLVAKLGLPVILVSRYYLGSINHTLLSVEALQSRKIPIKGIVFNGQEVPTSKEIILQRTGLEVIAEISDMVEVNQEMVIQNSERVVLSDFATERIF